MFVLVAALGGVGHSAWSGPCRWRRRVVQPFTYTLLIWAVLIGWLVFGDLPDAWTLLGASAIVGAGI